MSKYQQVQPVIPVAPGETLTEFLLATSMTQAELAARIDRPLKLVNEIVKGKAAITAETALQLEKVFGTSASFWNSLEATYRELLAREEEKAKLDQEFSEAKKYPVKEIIKYGWMPKAETKQQFIENLLTFFGVTSLENIIEKEKLPEAAFRIAKKQKYSIYSILAWLRQGVLEGQKIETADYNEQKLQNYILEIRTLTRENISEAVKRLAQIFSDCGIALVTIPHLPLAPINGASRWIAPNKAIVQLTIRNRYIDIFWFSVFHEIGHILLHPKKLYNIDFESNHENHLSLEKEADLFAADTLIPPDSYKELIKQISVRGYSNALLQKFADDICIHPAIVQGRLQKEKVIPYSFNHFRQQLEWKKD